MKRKIADLPPVDAEQFAQKVLGKCLSSMVAFGCIDNQNLYVAQQALHREEEERQGLSYECSTCR